MSVEVFAICYNEAKLLNKFILHYQDRFDADKITIYDNYSIDGSKEIIEQMGCTYIPYDSGGQIRDDIYLDIKNNCWKNSKADWVIVCDIDEFLEVDFDPSDSTILSVKGFDMVGDLNSRMGVPNKMYSKNIMFKPSEIKEINYLAGCHYSKPEGNIKFSRNVAKLLHRKYISEDYVFERHLMYQERLSDVNKQFGWGIEYQNVERKKIEEKFVELRKNAIEI